MQRFLAKYKYLLALWSLIGAYILYFSIFTILRYQTLYASYFDLGIMHQTVYNTYKAIVNLDPSRILELTNPFGPEQIKRIAIHNDILLAFLAPLYFIFAGPETLLVVQTVIVALGGLAVFGIAQKVFGKNHYRNLLSLVFAASYLLYPPLQRMNIYDFHAVALTTTFLLFMFYFWLKKSHLLTLLFFLLSILAKEQVALTTMFFGLYTLYLARNVGKSYRQYIFPTTVIIVSILWFLLSIFFVIPYFRGGSHFALEYYGDFNPANLARNIFHVDTLRYFFFLFGPLGFLSFFSPLQLLIAAPEFAVNLLSNNWHMRNIIFHYTAVIQPFIFISAIYGTKKSIEMLARMTKRTKLTIALCIIFLSLSFAFTKGPLPFSREQEVHPFKYPQRERNEVDQWKNILQSDSLKVSTTGQLAPHFTSRRYFYFFSEYYYLADYVVLRLGEIYNYPEKDKLIPVYEQLVFDPRFERVYKNGDFEVYKKL